MCINVSHETMQNMIYSHGSFQKKMISLQIAVPIVGGIVGGVLSLLAAAVVGIAVLIINPGSTTQAYDNGEMETVPEQFQLEKDKIWTGSFSEGLLKENKITFLFAAANICTAGIVGLIFLSLLCMGCIKFRTSN